MKTTTFHGLALLMRPLELGKTLGNMVFGATLAMYAATGTVSFAPANVAWFLWGFLSAALLWAGLYALNDFMDWKADAQHEVKKNRPIPSGMVSHDQAFFFSIALVVTAITLASFINIFFLATILFMLLNQLAYTSPPLELKKKPLFDLISGSMINPFFRFYAGWFLFQQNFGAPWLMIGFVVLLQFAGYALYRLSTVKHEKKLDYNVSSTVFGEKPVKAVAYIGMLIGSLCYISAPLTGILPFRFIWLAFLSLLALPWYWEAIRKPENVFRKRTYDLIYWHNIFFLAGFLILWVVEF